MIRPSDASGYCAPQRNFRQYAKTARGYGAIGKTDQQGLLLGSNLDQTALQTTRELVTELQSSKPGIADWNSNQRNGDCASGWYGMH
jgi:hypothetical protein